MQQQSERVEIMIKTYNRILGPSQLYTRFPETEHSAAACYHCVQPLDGVPVRAGYAAGSGAWSQYCAECGLRTFYDTPRMGGE